MVNKIRCVIFDWAGTTIDFGCFAPLEVFLDIFRSRDIAISLKEARKPMGMFKIDHIRAILEMKRVKEMWQDKFNRLYTEDDIKDLYADFEPALIKILPQFTDVIDGVLDVVNELREDEIKIGSTTGYTSEMMKIVTQCAREKGYAPDVLVTAEEVAGGRPHPYMIFKNMEKLEVYPPRCVIKIGDTATDILEGLNAGTWSVGVITGSSELGLKKEEYEILGREEKRKLKSKVEKRFYDAGAHYVIERMDELPKLISKINRKMRKEEN